jgi:F0F1-type ATP synthase membrane subunit b/b'
MELDIRRVQERIVDQLRAAEPQLKEATARVTELEGQLKEARRVQQQAQSRVDALRGSLDLAVHIDEEALAARTERPAERTPRGRTRSRSTPQESTPDA